MKIILFTLFVQIALFVHSAPVDDKNTHASVTTSTKNTTTGLTVTSGAEAVARSKRSSVAKSSSEAGLEGAKSSAIAVHTPDGPVTVNPVDEVTVNPNLAVNQTNVTSTIKPELPVIPAEELKDYGGHHGGGGGHHGGGGGGHHGGGGGHHGGGGGHHGGGGGHHGGHHKINEEEEDLPEEQQPEGPVSPSPVSPTPVLPGDVKSTKIQNIEATANMETGVAIATASKRAVDAPVVIQTVKSSGAKSIASAENKKPVNGTVAQSVTANGDQLAVATAASGNRVARDINSQAVKASGNKAIASATNHNSAETNVQHVQANGGELAVATASSGDSSVPSAPGSIPDPRPSGYFRRPDGPIPQPIQRQVRRDTTVQVVGAKGDKAISTAKAETNGTVNTLQNVTSIGNTLAVATATS